MSWPDLKVWIRWCSSHNVVSSPRQRQQRNAACWLTTRSDYFVQNVSNADVVVPRSVVWPAKTPPAVDTRNFSAEGSSHNWSRRDTASPHKKMCSSTPGSDDDSSHCLSPPVVPCHWPQLAPGNLKQEPVRSPWSWDREVVQGVFFHLVDSVWKCASPFATRIKARWQGTNIRLRSANMHRRHPWWCSTDSDASTRDQHPWSTWGGDFARLNEDGIPGLETRRVFQSIPARAHGCWLERDACETLVVRSRWVSASREVTKGVGWRSAAASVWTVFQKGESVAMSSDPATRKEVYSEQSSS